MSLKLKKERIILKKVDSSSASYYTGGMWKIAYADFVTAMMAFFMLMWILSATPNEKLKGIAEYFANKSRKKDVQIEQISNDVDDSSDLKMSDDEKDFFLALAGSIKNIKEVSEYSENIKVDITSEGLRIQIMDSDKRPMFKPGTNILQRYMEDILINLATIINPVQNYISISGNTASIKNPDSVDLWSLSINRANKVRIFLSDVISPSRIVKIVGNADKDLVNTHDPYAPQNIRISLTLLSKSFINKNKSALPNKMLED